MLAGAPGNCLSVNGGIRASFVSASHERSASGKFMALSLGQEVTKGGSFPDFFEDVDGAHLNSLVQQASISQWPPWFAMCHSPIRT